ncbi:Asp-tRNA(Asn)/Glu-tRNA(Gln) amidotransferase subunit GatC [bacterium]|nr:Asp-tRNA(Asn)/Glu-tRNA(Gln) amidotransferase subunit GatC [bacterium]
MKITKKEVEYVADLACMEISEEEKEIFTRQLDSILSYMEKLNQLDTKDIEPTSHVLQTDNVFREDKVKPSLPQDEALANAPDKKNGFFRVPRVIEEN